MDIEAKNVPTVNISFPLILEYVRIVVKNMTNHTNFPKLRLHRTNAIYNWID